MGGLSAEGAVPRSGCGGLLGHLRDVQAPDAEAGELEEEGEEQCFRVFPLADLLCEQKLTPEDQENSVC